MKPILIPQQGNPLYPLPPDYADMTVDGQRLARVNACRQWLVKDVAPEVVADGFAASLRFFDLYYLWPDHEADFDPLFYDDDPLDAPPFHEDIVRLWAVEPRSITIAPRGSAKSFLFRKTTMLRMMTRPAYSIIYATSTGDNAKGMGQSMKDQFVNNRRLWDDWAPEFPGGRVTPKRGEATFGTTYMHLKNGSWLRAISAESRQRGGRPRRYVLDDPEYDPKASTSMEVLRDYMSVLLFRVVLPMVFRKGCGVDWLATYVSRRHYAWYATQTELNADGKEVAIDDRFDTWTRMVIRAAYEDDEGEIQSCWPDMWPSTVAVRDANPNWKDRVSLEEMRRAIGTANFNSEMMARPGEGDDIYFPNLKMEAHGYELKMGDGLLENEPFRSSTIIRWFSEKQQAYDERSLRDFLKGCRTFMTVDTSYTSGRDSDRKACMLCAVNWEGDLFALDLWSAQCDEPTLVKNTLKMADRWRCRSVHVEYITSGISVYDSLLAAVASRDPMDTMGITHLPGIRKLKPGRTEKVAKISALHPRFEFGRVKLPLKWRTKTPWSRLMDQIEEFNPSAVDGGLQHDDELDLLAMEKYVLGSRRLAPTQVTEVDLSPIERMKRGETHDKQGQPIGMGIDWLRVPIEDVMEVMALRDDVRQSDGSSRV